MDGFLVISDDDYRAFINVEMICMFRVRKNAAGQMPSGDDIEEVEVEFLGGATKRLFGETARHFVHAVGKYLASRGDRRTRHPES